MSESESVEKVKGMVAEVFREKKELVWRLNIMHEAIEDEEDLKARVLRKFEWMEEKERSVERLNKVRHFPTSFPPSSKLALPQLP